MRARLLSLVAAYALVALALCGCAASGASDVAGRGADNSDRAGQSASAEGNVDASPDSAEGAAAGAVATESEAETMVIVRVNGEEMRMRLEQNRSAQALAKLLEASSASIDMDEYGGFEKVGALPESLPADDERITTKPGDVVLYQGNKMCIYYGTNTWSFTRLGFIEGVSADELKDMLGTGDVVAELSLG